MTQSFFVRYDFIGADTRTTTDCATWHTTSMRKTRAMPTPPLPPHIEFIARGLFVHGGHVLVCWNRKGDYGYLPGGHIEPGESGAEALTREMREETGLDCRVGPLLLTHENRFATRKRVHHELNLVFSAEVTDRSFRAAATEMCHVAQADGKSSRSNRRASTLTTHPSPPHVASQESHLEFRWLAPLPFRRADIRPRPMAKWASRLLTGGMKSTTGLRPTDSPTGEFLSTMRLPDRPK